MQLTAILTTVLNIFANSPDLCAEVLLDADGQPWTDSLGQTLSRYCQWTGPDAPVLDAEICCDIEDDAAACVLPDPSGGCPLGDRYSCRYGKVIRGGVICLQPFPDACELGHCVKAPELLPPTHADLLCCHGSWCVDIPKFTSGDCDDAGGEVSWCDFGETHTDGTVTCHDLD